MPDDVPAGETPSPASLPLTQHLDAVYAVARALVPAARADDLVAEAYRRAAARPPAARPADACAWLTRLLLEAHAEGTFDKEEEGDDAPPLDALRAQIVRRALDWHLASSFAACPARAQLALTLAAQDVDDDALAQALRLDPEAARRQRRQAEATLRRVLAANLAPAERALVRDRLTPEGLRTALRRLLDTEVSGPTATLRAEVAAALHDAQGEATDEAEAPPAAAAADDAPGRAATGHRPAEREAVQREVAAREATGGADRRQRVRSVMVGVLAVALLVAGLFAARLLLRPTPTPEPTLLSVAARQAATVEPLIETSDAARAERFARERLGRDLAVPRIDGARLRGVGVAAPVPNVDVPFFLYADSSAATGSAEAGGRLVVFAYSYTLLDVLEDRLGIERALRKDLADERTLTARRVEGDDVLVWRVRDDVYAALAPEGTPGNLRARIRDVR